MTAPWTVAPPAPAEAAGLAREIGLPDPLGQVLLNRGYRSAAEADGFLRPRLSGLGDPFALPGMASAADRLMQAVRGRERVLIFGDYDVDGITATALLSRVLKTMGARVRVFLPHRVRDGYGLSEAAIERSLGDGDVDLMVTVDCGTNARGAADAVRRRGVDLVITDHHQPEGDPPDAVAVVNPRYASGATPWRDLAGVGVAFKVAHALLKQARAEGHSGAAEIDLRSVLDWVALGTVADAVPLAGENRVLTRHGLARAAEAPSPGLSALCAVAGLRGRLDAWHLGYVLGPRLNAAGRLATPDEALALLLSEDAASAAQLARSLDRLNQDRQRIERDVIDVAVEQVRDQAGASDWDGLVAAGTGWHPGVIGIVAARLSAMFRKPALVFALREDGSGRGSGRGPAGFNLIEALHPCADHLVRFGGHAAAVGMDLKPGLIDAFRAAFSASVKAARPDAGAMEPLVADGLLSLGEADDRLLDAMDAFRPFGQGNPAPLWIARGLHVVSTRSVGNGQHRSFRLAEGGVERAAIGFNMGEGGEPPPRVDALFEVQRNTYAGRTSIQLRLDALCPA